MTKNFIKCAMVATMAIAAGSASASVGTATRTSTELGAKLAEAILNAEKANNSALMTLRSKLGIRQGATKADIEAVLAKASKNRGSSFMADLQSVVSKAQSNPKASYLEITAGLTGGSALFAEIGNSTQAKQTSAFDSILKNQNQSKEVRACGIDQITKDPRVLSVINAESTCELGDTEKRALVNMVGFAVNSGANTPSAVVSKMQEYAVGHALLDVNKDGVTTKDEAKAGLKILTENCNLIKGAVAEKARAI